MKLVRSKVMQDEPKAQRTIRAQSPASLIRVGADQHHPHELSQKTTTPASATSVSNCRHRPLTVKLELYPGRDVGPDGEHTSGTGRNCFG
jgi:hypothetical protein